MAATCTATRKDGSACVLPAIASGAYCFAHDAAARAARATGGRHSSLTVRAGKYLPPQLQKMQTRLLSLVDELGDGTTSPAVGQAIIAAVGKLLELAKFSLQTSETRELEQRIATLEAMLSEGRRRA